MESTNQSRTGGIQMIADTFTDVRRYGNRDLLVGILEMLPSEEEEDRQKIEEFVHELLRRVRVAEQWAGTESVGYTQ